MLRAYETYRERGFEIVGVDHDEDPAVMVESARRQGFTWPQWHAGDRRQEVADTFWVSGLPTNILVGRDGRIVWRGNHVPHGEEFTRLIETALGGP